MQLFQQLRWDKTLMTPLGNVGHCSSKDKVILSTSGENLLVSVSVDFFWCIFSGVDGTRLTPGQLYPRNSLTSDVSQVIQLPTSAITPAPMLDSLSSR